MSRLFLLRGLAALAALGFLMSAAAHLLAFCGIDILGGMDGLCRKSLHWGVMIVLLPTFYFSNRTSRDWKVAWLGSPNWVRVTATMLLAYAFLHFIISGVSLGAGAPSPSTESLVLVRGFTGLYVWCYFVEFALICSIIKPRFFC